MEVIKLGTLLLKTLSKPLSKSLKTRLTTHPKATAWTVSVGQFTHQVWSKITIAAAGHKSLRVKPLDEATALSQGAEFLSEGFVFGVAGAAVLFEMNRADAIKAADGAKKKAVEQAKDDQMLKRLESIECRLCELEESRVAAERSQGEAGQVRERAGGWALGSWFRLPSPG